MPDEEKVWIADVHTRMPYASINLARASGIRTKKTFTVKKGSTKAVYGFIYAHRINLDCSALKVFSDPKDAVKHMITGLENYNKDLLAEKESVDKSLKELRECLKRMEDQSLKGD